MWESEVYEVVREVEAELEAEAEAMADKLTPGRRIKNKARVLRAIRAANIGRLEALHADGRTEEFCAAYAELSGDPRIKRLFEARAKICS